MKNTDRLNRYSLVVEYIENEGFVASYKELGSSATGYGDTRADAIEDLEAAVADLLEVTDEEFPEPQRVAPWSTYSGRVTLRISRSLHGQLNELADEQRVSLNSLMSDILRSGATALRAGLHFGCCELSASAVRPHVDLAPSVNDQMLAIEAGSAGDLWKASSYSGRISEPKKRPFVHYGIINQINEPGAVSTSVVSA